MGGRHWGGVGEGANGVGKKTNFFVLISECDGRRVIEGVGLGDESEGGGEKAILELSPPLSGVQVKR